MKPRQPVVATFDELMASRYGKADRRLLRGAETTEELFADYYGNLPVRKNGTVESAVTLSVTCDDGKQVLAQRNRLPNSMEGESHFPRASLPDNPHRRIGPVEAPATETSSIPAQPAIETTKLPLKLERAETAEPDLMAIKSAAVPQFLTSSPASATPATALPLSHVSSQADSAPASATDEDFIADMQSIFTGQSVYDPLTKKTVSKDKLKEYQREVDAEDDPLDRPLPMAPGSSHEIFDRIAQSMQYAGAYDLGTVELENRFADFDRIDALKKKAAVENKATPKPVPAQQIHMDGLGAGPREFLEDLEAIKQQAAGDIDASHPQTIDDPNAGDSYSEPLFDTGEHVLAGGDLYVDRLLVGKPPGVAFSYGEIIAMADLFTSVDEMMAEDVGILRNLQRLIEQSTRYYAGNKSPSLKDVKNEQWNIATGGRYMKLAEDNYDHFAPNLIYKNEAFARNAIHHSNHRNAWEQHHERAIKAAQEMALDPANANVSYVPIRPLIINAFGDHFLTDAFAAGHVINKDVVSAYFKSTFYTGTSLKPEARRFFEQLAVKAWHGDVAAKFKQLQTVEAHLLVWHPDIKNAERFGKVLIGAAEQEPDKIANMAVKAVHDVLNREGIEVVNDAGSAPWKLTGDGNLTPATLAVMKQAVLASAETITDPGILRSNLQIQNYFAKVWAFVPKLTPASEIRVKRLISDYVAPTSTELINAAATIIQNEVDLLVKELIDKKALQRI